jgi:uncharacterized DUF497 family protein
MGSIQGQFKEQTNISKHGVNLQRAATVFRDPLALTIPDEDHVESENRWITLGRDATSRYLLVVHTLEEMTRACSHY